MEIVIIAASVLAAYLIGSLPTSYIIARSVKGIDIRTAGSGNAGATNVLRTVGRLPAVITLAIDVVKGVIPVTLLVALTYPAVANTVRKDLYVGIMALAVVSGHIWPVFLKFRGGKGVATTLGVAIAVTPLALIPSFLVWLTVFMASKYVSLASIVALLTFPVAVTLISYSFYTVVFAVIICAIGIYKHKDNVTRLLKGEEHKTVLGKKRTGINPQPQPPSQ